MYDAVCFTCGAEATFIVKLTRGCSVYPTDFPIYVGLCPQHWYSINPIDLMENLTPEAADGHAQ